MSTRGVTVVTMAYDPKRVRAAVDQALREIDALPAQPAFDAATALARLLGEQEQRATAARHAAAARIAAEESLSLAALADRLGVSRQRAHVILRNARPAQEEGK